MLSTHVIRLGTHAEKDYLLRAYAWFDEVLLNANLVEGTAASLGVFLTEMRDKEKGYFIDPMTYAFALSPDLLMRGEGLQPSRSRLKRTFRGLAERYGKIVNQHAGEQALQPADFTSEEDKEELCQSVLNYQRDRVVEALIGSQDFLMTEVPPLIPTKFVVPYFHLSGDMDWLDLNVDLAERTCRIESNAWVVVCLDSLLLDFTQSLDQVTKLYKDLNTPGYLLWITDFNEERATGGQISGLRKLISELSHSGTKPVINLFGGYFSCLLTEYGLTGISHGLGYGERHSIEPVLGGGLPPAKYYLPAIHQHIRIDQLVSIATGLNESSFSDQICNCVICEGLLRQGFSFLIDQYTASEVKIVRDRYRQVATPQVYRLTRYHYLSNKHLEFRGCGQLAHDDLLDQLDVAYNQFRNQLGTASLMYLRIWKNALS